VHVPGAPLLWLIVGDGARAGRKYGDRAARFLLLEAGHLMQNLCLLSTTLGLCTVPLGGFFEEELRRLLDLPGTDEVLYVGACGEAVGG
jgi:SagB-type dehydrogenase family enzyme